jgi:hypothetical protein
MKALKDEDIEIHQDLGNVSSTQIHKLMKSIE